jgi:hypothetical protein
MITAQIRCKAFTTEGVRLNKIALDPRDNSIRVWDSVAGHYTIPRISERAQARIARAVHVAAERHEATHEQWYSDDEARS